LRELQQKAEMDEKPWKFEATDPELLTRYAIRLGGAQGVPAAPGDAERKTLKRIVDVPKARKVFADVMELTKDKVDQRAWYLMALRERGASFDPKADDPTVRVDKVKALLSEVKAEWAAVKDDPEARLEKRNCRIRCRDLFELYADETEASLKALIDEAKSLYSQMK
jgi:hypothetical protein